ncbi:hypothetical protein K488DRAFT_82988 [Vararia minispora EC-137]|uniref:Uncharacterized protein n=1 Tax=Vararia minispora EC-137 TaxID=1314806 RepID=A0ACB8QUH2_9AGAM|nr:hypothetical protein K488DRAFT_82988 [Vararia minispora EC-137]
MSFPLHISAPPFAKLELHMTSPMPAAQVADIDKRRHACKTSGKLASFCAGVLQELSAQIRIAQRYVSRFAVSKFHGKLTTLCIAAAVAAAGGFFSENPRRDRRNTANASARASALATVHTLTIIDVPPQSVASDLWRVRFALVALDPTHHSPTTSSCDAHPARADSPAARLRPIGSFAFRGPS